MGFFVDDGKMTMYGGKLLNLTENEVGFSDMWTLDVEKLKTSVFGPFPEITTTASAIDDEEILQNNENSNENLTVITISTVIPLFCISVIAIVAVWFIRRR